MKPFNYQFITVNFSKTLFLVSVFKTYLFARESIFVPFWLRNWQGEQSSQSLNTHRWVPSVIGVIESHTCMITKSPAWHIAKWIHVSLHVHCGFNGGLFLKLAIGGAILGTYCLTLKVMCGPFLNSRLNLMLITQLLVLGNGYHSTKLDVAIW